MCAKWCVKIGGYPRRQCCVSTCTLHTSAVKECCRYLKPDANILRTVVFTGHFNAARILLCKCCLYDVGSEATESLLIYQENARTCARSRSSRLPGCFLVPNTCLRSFLHPRLRIRMCAFFKKCTKAIETNFIHSTTRQQTTFVLHYERSAIGKC